VQKFGSLGFGAVINEIQLISVSAARRIIESLARCAIIGNHKLMLNASVNMHIVIQNSKRSNINNHQHQ
jgi:hypothetical protein